VHVQKVQQAGKTELRRLVSSIRRQVAVMQRRYAKTKGLGSQLPPSHMFRLAFQPFAERHHGIFIQHQMMCYKMPLSEQLQESD